MASSLPQGWTQLCSKTGETFFYHFETGERSLRFCRRADLRLGFPFRSDILRRRWITFLNLASSFDGQF